MLLDSIETLKHILHIPQSKLLNHSHARAQKRQMTRMLLPAFVNQH